MRRLLLVVPILVLALFVALVLPRVTADWRAHARAGRALRAGATHAVTLEIGGMTCAACVKKVHAQLASVPGVRGVSVSLATQRALVQCDPAVADTSLTDAVRRAGAEYLGLVVSR